MGTLQRDQGNLMARRVPGQSEDSIAVRILDLVERIAGRGQRALEMDVAHAHGADAEADAGRVADVIALIGKAGIGDLALITRPAAIKR